MLRSIFFYIILMTGIGLNAQPTGHQRIYIELVDFIQGQWKTIGQEQEPFMETKYTMKFGNYEIKDVSKDLTGFKKYSRRLYIHKTLMTEREHHIQVIRNKVDTMNIKVVNGFDVFYLKVCFQKGNYLIYIQNYNQDNKYGGYLPKKVIDEAETAKDITPIDWNLHQEIPSFLVTDFRYDIMLQYDSPVRKHLMYPDEVKPPKPSETNQDSLSVSLVKPVYKRGEMIQIKIKGEVMLDGGGSNSVVFYYLEKKTDSGFVEIYNNVKMQMDWGLPTNRAMNIQQYYLRGINGEKESKNIQSIELAAGIYRIAVLDPNRTKHYSSEFTIQ